MSGAEAIAVISYIWSTLITTDRPVAWLVFSAWTVVHELWLWYYPVILLPLVWPRSQA